MKLIFHAKLLHEVAEGGAGQVFPRWPRQRVVRSDELFLSESHDYMLPAPLAGGVRVLPEILVDLV
jgi:hypothetical protein